MLHWWNSPCGWPMVSFHPYRRKMSQRTSAPRTSSRTASVIPNTNTQVLNSSTTNPRVPQVVTDEIVQTSCRNNTVNGAHLGYFLECRGDRGEFRAAPRAPGDPDRTHLQGLSQFSITAIVMSPVHADGSLRAGHRNGAASPLLSQSRNRRATDAIVPTLVPPIPDRR
jgi:hypothetical protein